MITDSIEAILNILEISRMFPDLITTEKVIATRYVPYVLLLHIITLIIIAENKKGSRLDI